MRSNMKMQPRSPAPTGFTLVELLVVVVIVTALAFLGFTAARDMRDNANLSACATNMRNIGIAMQIYADDHQGFYPDTTHSQSADKAWIYQLEAYLGDFDESRICPADPRRKERLANKASSYVLNDAVFAPEIDELDPENSPPAYNKPSLLPDPSNTILLFIVADSKAPYPGEDHTHVAYWSSWRGVISDIAPDRHRRRSSTHFTKGSSNYLYADSSVRTYTAHEIKKKIESGRNIGAIPGINR